MIDYKELLHKYIKHFLENEDPCYFDWMLPPNITEEEAKIVKEIAKEYGAKID